MPIILELLLLLDSTFIQVKYWPSQYISISILYQLVVIRHNALYSEPITSIESDRSFIDCLYMQVNWCYDWVALSSQGFDNMFDEYASCDRKQGLRIWNHHIQARIHIPKPRFLYFLRTPRVIIYTLAVKLAYFEGSFRQHIAPAYSLS